MKSWLESETKRQRIDLAKHLFPQLVSISETFYEQLLLTLVPKVQKGSDDLIVYFSIWCLCM